MKSSNNLKILIPILGIIIAISVFYVNSWGKQREINKEVEIEQIHIKNDMNGVKEDIKDINKNINEIKIEQAAQKTNIGHILDGIKDIKKYLNNTEEIPW